MATILRSAHQVPIQHKRYTALSLPPRPVPLRGDGGARVTRVQVAMLQQGMSTDDEPCEVFSALPSEHCFALSTMSVDGQQWVMEELSHALVGLTHHNPRVAVRTTHLLDYKGDLGNGRKAMRCEKLELDLLWEATAKAAEGVVFTGHAKVTMDRVGGCDTVDVAVAVDPASALAASPRCLADVEYAVRCLDAAIMTRLNDFLWSMEQRNPLRHALDRLASAV